MCDMRTRYSERWPYQSRTQCHQAQVQDKSAEREGENSRKGEKDVRMYEMHPFGKSK